MGRDQTGAPSAATTIERLDRNLAHVREPAMRRRLVAEALAEEDPEQLLDLLSEVLNRPPGESACGSAVDLLRETLHEVLLESDEEWPLSYELRRSLYESASEVGDQMLMRVLRSVASPSTTDGGAGSLPPDLADLPLGRRRSLARGGNRGLLEKLALDSDPVVIRHLLLNPRLREEDVIRIAALRPVPASTLVEVHRSRRWSTRTRVRVALARNPYTPVPIAAKVMGGIPLRDLEEMHTDGRLPEETRLQVEAELARRRSAVSSVPDDPGTDP